MQHKWSVSGAGIFISTIFTLYFRSKHEAMKILIQPNAYSPEEMIDIYEAIAIAYDKL